MSHSVWYNERTYSQHLRPLLFTFNVRLYEVPFYWFDPSEARQSITNMVISELLTASRCYQDCEPWGDNLSHVCNGDQPNNLGKPNELNQLSRSCFPEDKMRCQMQCLTKQNANNRKTFLPGLTKLKDFGITPEDLSKNSWRAYRNSGFNSYDAQDMVVDGQLKPSSTSLRLPVCVAREGQQRITMLKRKESWSRGMPINCGYRAEDTQRFHERIGLDVNKEPEYRRWHVFAVSNVSISCSNTSLTDIIEPQSYSNPSWAIP